MRGKLMHFVTAVALITCIASAVLWWRSYQWKDYAAFRSWEVENHATFRFIRKTNFEVGISSDRGAIVLGKDFKEQLDQWSPNYPAVPLTRSFEYGSSDNRPAAFFGAIGALPVEPAWFPIRFEHDSTRYFVVKIPILGITISAALFVAILSWKIVRRKNADSNICRKCGYLLTGNISGICPECGTPKPVSAKLHSRPHAQ